ncbi:Rpn family recombination-promoting nuclease/putative transposase [Scytonema sp. PCC 10023]|uniref:Rpn family recombination-promoting nuclease/putative transposase n=1 Tax=Scytonema sp. PCC 10023 TaxID=1680591 RepID=UPI0039C689F0
MANPALLPLATLARSDSPNSLLEQVAAQVDMIEENDERQNISACTQILAGLRFDKNLIQRLFREEIMQESVIYQDILQKGEQKGKKQEALAYTMRLLNRRIGSVNPQLQEQIRSLSVPQLEDLGEALLDFSSETDLINWLATQLS